MRRIWLLGLTFVALTLAVRAEQLGTTPQHAPTAEQCQADAKVWGNQSDENDYMKAEGEHINLGIPDESLINKLPVTQVAARMYEMGTCGDVDPGNQAQYTNVANFYLGVEAAREMSYLKRHALWQQFLAEDADGLR